MPNADRVLVISPEDSEQVERLAHALGQAEAVYARPSDVTLHYNPELMQAALRSLLAPPKPDEPTGLGAVVEDQRGEWWVRDKTTTTVNHWKRARGEDGGRRYPYADIAAVRVISLGVAE
jgi:hypothetical protein